MNMRPGDMSDSQFGKQVQRKVGANWKVIAYLIGLALAGIAAWYSLKERVALVERDMIHIEKSLDEIKDDVKHIRGLWE